MCHHVFPVPGAWPLELFSMLCPEKTKGGIVIIKPGNNMVYLEPCKEYENGSIHLCVYGWLGFFHRAHIKSVSCQLEPRFDSSLIFSGASFSASIWTQCHDLVHSIQKGPLHSSTDACGVRREGDIGLI